MAPRLPRTNLGCSFAKVHSKLCRTHVGWVLHSLFIRLKPVITPNAPAQTQRAMTNAVQLQGASSYYKNYISGSASYKKIGY